MFASFQGIEGSPTKSRWKKHDNIGSRIQEGDDNKQDDNRLLREIKIVQRNLNSTRYRNKNNGDKTESYAHHELEEGKMYQKINWITFHTIRIHY